MPDSVREVLARASVQNSYGSVAGLGWRSRRGGRVLRAPAGPTDPDQIVFAPGSKPLLWALIETIAGDVILPQPSWVSYGVQAQIAGRRVWPVEIKRGRAGYQSPPRCDWPWPASGSRNTICSRGYPGSLALATGQTHSETSSTHLDPSLPRQIIP